jgi:hypothetical protein
MSAWCHERAHAPQQKVRGVVANYLVGVPARAAAIGGVVAAYRLELPRDFGFPRYLSSSSSSSGRSLIAPSRKATL